MKQYILQSTEARKALLKGAETLYLAVKETLGPRGRNVMIKTPQGFALTHDGVTVARHTSLAGADPGVALGADLIRSAASTTESSVGDGTTTATVLTYHLLKAAHSLIAAGHNPMQLARELESAAGFVTDVIPALAESIADSPAKVTQVAALSAGDKELGEVVAEAVLAAGPEGAVVVERSATAETYALKIAGFEIAAGYLSPYLITDPAHLRAVKTGAPVLVYGGVISSIQQLVPILEKINNAGTKDLVLVAEDVTGEALQTLILNHAKGVFSTLIIKAPGFGAGRDNLLEDLATFTGATLISPATGLTLAGMDVGHLGRASVRSDASTSVFTDGLGTKEAIERRIRDINEQLGDAPSDFEAERLRGRIAALKGQAAVIKVGALTEAAAGEKQYRVDDAVAATKAAVAGGIVPGGGVTLVNIASQLAGDTQGEKLLKEALTEPFKQLMTNSGYSGEALLGRVQTAKPGMGFSVDDPHRLIDVKKAGIIDPAKVTTTTIQTACSVAASAITVGAILEERDEPTDVAD